MLKLYQSNRMEYLADLLIEITRPPPADPFAAETVIVQHPEMGRWLSLQIAERTGVCANFRFPLPAGFIWDLFSRLIPGLPEHNRYAPDVMHGRCFHCLGKQLTSACFIRSADIWRVPVKTRVSNSPHASPPASISTWSIARTG